MNVRTSDSELPRGDGTPARAAAPGPPPATGRAPLVPSPFPGGPGVELPAGLPETWTFGRDLPCPQCSYNLRARREPRCPECGLRFRWQAILGVVCPRCAGSLRDESGQVCPHCFATLNWVQIFGKADPRQQLDFEHSVRWAKPFGHTLVATLNPWTFWKARRLETPPNRARLTRFRRVAIGIGLVGLVAPLLTRALGWAYVDLRDWAALAAGVLLPPLVCLGLIDRYGWARIHRGLRWERTARAVAMSCSVLAWHGLLLTLASVIAALVNIVYPLIENQRFSRPANALHLQSDAFFNYLVTGRAGYAWHWGEAWFNIALGGALTFVAVGWWWPFLYLALRRCMKLPWSETVPLLVAGLTTSYLLVFVVWMNVIPLSPFVVWLTRFLR